MSSRCTAESAWTEPETVLSDWTGGGQTLSIGIDRFGNGLAVWFMNDSLRNSVFSSSYLAPPPDIELTSPSSDIVDVPVVVVSGVTDPYSVLLVNGIHVAVEGNGSFLTAVVLSNGTNQIVLVATDSAGRSTSLFVNVTYNDPLQSLRTKLDSAEETLLIVGIALVVTVSVACIMTVLYMSLRKKRSVP
jgi:hypothetical protein